MNELRQQAERYIQRVEKLKEQLAELEEFQEALLNPSGSDVKISIEISKGRIYQAWLDQDLGITIIQAELIKKLITETHTRKAVLEKTLTQLIGGNE